MNAPLKTLALTCALVALFVFPALAQDDAPDPVHAPETLPGVEPEMLTADYWIALQPDADDVIMTPSEIEAFNERISSKEIVFEDRHGKKDPMISFWDFVTTKGLLMHPVNPLELAATVPGDSVRTRLERNREWLYDPMPLWGSTDFYDDRNTIYTGKMKDTLAASMNLDAIPDTVTRRYGILVNHVNARYYPTNVPGYQNERALVDRFQAGSLLVGTPVAVLHQSADGAFLYIESPVSRCWVNAKDVAVAPRETIAKLAGADDFLLAAGSTVPVYGDPSFTAFSRYFYFAAKLPLVAHDDNGYVVALPCRNEDGTLRVENGFVKPDADVHIGYFPYTKRNVLKQVFKLMDQPYGWEDQDNKRDCCGTMHVLLKCFGIQTGRWVNHVLLAADNQYYMDPALSTEEKLEKAAELEPVITMCGTAGHIVLYLGKAANGRQYFIHQAGWGYDVGAQHYWVNRHTVNELTHSWYSVDAPRVWSTFRP